MKQVSSFFTNQANYQQALVHRSYCHDHPTTSSNERLEFLGDSVLSLIISNRLYNFFPNLNEGDLTGRRSHLVCTETLAKKSLTLGLDAEIKMSKGEEDSGGRKNPSLLANTFEAVLGSLYLDSGLSVCEQFLNHIYPDTEIRDTKELLKDSKSLLQEKTQSKNWGTPIYETVSAEGPDHAKTFTVQVIINGKTVSTGTGTSKQRAETAAAQAALEILFSKC